MPPLINISGRRYGHLVVLRDSGKRDGQGKVLWLCLCDCGVEKIVRGYHLASGGVISCGCKRPSNLEGHRHSPHRHSHTTHSSRSRTYSSWSNMKQRCMNSKAPNYHHYGGRGISVCDRWLMFDNFLADMGERPVGTSIDRIDNNGDYEPSNCQWADAKTQRSNRRSN